MDTQGHLGKSLGVEGRLLETTVSELLNRSVRDWRKATQPTRIDNLHVLPSDKRLAQVSVGMGIGSAGCGAAAPYSGPGGRKR